MGLKHDLKYKKLQKHLSYVLVTIPSYLYQCCGATSVVDPDPDPDPLGSGTFAGSGSVT
jgi:hypothetical protein